MRSLLALAIVALATTAVANQSSFDCPMRQLGMEFAAKLQPFRSKDSFQAIADALSGSADPANCTVTVPSGVGAPQWPPAFKTLTPLSSTYFADAAKGSDSNDGSEAHPFKTIGKAVSAARAGSHPATVNLRAGTFYIADTINLGPSDSGLTIQAYNGEDVVISGGVPLTNLSWKVFNTTGGNGTWAVYQNIDAVYDDAGTPTTPLYGHTDTYQECEAACQANSSCNAWTWHDKNQGTYALDCYFRTDNTFIMHSESGHVSGRRPAPEVTILSADLSHLNVAAIPGLRQNGQRLIRARYPNANPEEGFGSSLMAKGWSKPTTPTQPAKEVSPHSPRRNNSYGFNYYQLGVGGPCEHFDPPAGYWCGNQTSGGGAFTYRVPSGMVADQEVLPNMPAGGYANVDKAVVQTWRPAHWASWMFQVGSFDADSNTFTFAKGGFQGARGNNNGDNFYIENLMEELDAMDEWYYSEDTQTLYLAFNQSGLPPSSVEFVATNAKVLFNATGSSMTDPIKGVSFKGVTLRDTAYTYLDPHGMPSGGDWALQRTAAIFLQRTEDVTIEACTFVRLDGNAVMVSAYNRGLFAWIGDNIIAQWGNAEGSGVPGMGWDGTNGDQPRGSVISNNLAHEIGIWEKQSSFYFQAKTAQVLIMNNVVFSGSRALINFNDGFGGGGNITRNVLFNACRESGDHGPFNSWDRQLYVTKVRNGTASPYKAFDDISHNYVIANYNSQEAIDNDDGSCYYHTHDNFFAYSGNGLKSDFGGHSNHAFDNVYAYVGHGFGITHQDPGFADEFSRNHVVMTKDGDYGNPQCENTSQDAKTVVYNNTIYTPNGKVTECGMSLQAWQAKGNDPGTVAKTWPTDDELLTLARGQLNM